MISGSMPTSLRLFMSLFFIVVLSTVSTSQTVSPDELLRRVRIETSDVQTLEYELANEGFDVIGSMTPASLDVIVSREEMAELLDKGLNPNVIREGRPLRDRASEPAKAAGLPDDYPSLDEILTLMNETAADCQHIARVIDITASYHQPATFEGRHLYAIKISDNVELDEDEPDMMIVSNHHAREVVTPVIALYAMAQFTSKYGIDPRITAAVNENEIWIAPTWNPDGYDYVFNVDDYWRKNRHVFDSGIGVDLNRNYPHLWHSPRSGSYNVNSNTFKGYSPASEPETKTMIALARDQRFAKLIDYHSSGREALWGYAETPHPFDDWLQQEAISLAIRSGYFGENRRPSADGENYQWHLAKTGTYSNLVETHTEFSPGYASATAEAERVWPGILWEIERPIPLSGHVTDGSTGLPVEADIELVGVNFQTGETNASGGPFGRYHLFAPPSEYRIRFSADGYAPVEKLVAITETAQVLDIQLSSTTDVASAPEQTDTPASMILLTNYPNPFNPATSIHYRIAESGHVRLDIVNPNGRLAKTLVDGVQEKTGYTIRWNGTDESGRPVAGGIYFSRMTLIASGKKVTQSRKMLLLK